jgi:hypothetical protein
MLKTVSAHLELIAAFCKFLVTRLKRKMLFELMFYDACMSFFHENLIAFF